MPQIVFPDTSGNRKLSTRSELLRGNSQSVSIGSDEGKSQFDTKGVLSFEGDAVVWDEVSASFVGNRIFVSAGRVDYNYDELTVDFTDTARYPDEPVGIVKQMVHARKLGTPIRPHIHWIQTNDAIPNILVVYRWTNNGEVPGAWTQKALGIDDTVFPYAPGIMQIINFNMDEAEAIAAKLSATFEVKVYRDSNNTSGLFAGADVYAGTWSVKYYDIHLQIDGSGSRKEFIK